MPYNSAILVFPPVLLLLLGCSPVAHPRIAATLQPLLIEFLSDAHAAFQTDLNAVILHDYSFNDGPHDLAILSGQDGATEDARVERIQP